jgi:hypothetical protein
LKKNLSEATTIICFQTSIAISSILHVTVLRERAKFLESSFVFGLPEFSTKIDMHSLTISPYEYLFLTWPVKGNFEKKRIKQTIQKKTVGFVP